MSEPKRPEATPNTPRTIAWCTWHRGYSDTARLIQIVEQGSGPGAHLYACAACREQHHLVPLGDQR